MITITELEREFGLSRPEAIRLGRLLGKRGVGRFLKGVKGWPSRIERSR